MPQQIIFTQEPYAAIDSLSRGEKTFMITDENTARIAVDIKEHSGVDAIRDARILSIPAGDENKTLKTLTMVWQILAEKGATRHSLIVNVGGGVVTDLGGMAAATFKRGMRFINVPTTVLGAVDAAVGGKTGINFMGLKNEIGVFREADAVVITPRYFATLPEAEVLSGYGEMLKHSLLDSPQAFAEALQFDLAEVTSDGMLNRLEESVALKTRIVTEDPLERGLRKALNLGHTAGHAFESLSLKFCKRVPHGQAVAWGLVVAAVLSHIRLAFPATDLRRLSQFVENHYGAPDINCGDYEDLLRLMHHDKKNADAASDVRFTLLRAPGEVAINQSVSDDEITAALDLMRDLLGV